MLAPSNPVEDCLAKPMQSPSPSTNPLSIKNLAPLLEPFKQRSDRRASVQVITSVVVFAAVFSAMYIMLGIIGWWGLLAAPLMALCWLRLFVLQHDCGHGSLFRSKQLNRWVGRGLGIVTFTPFDDWAYNHNLHHATSGKLSKRGWDRDVYSMTVSEYEESSPLLRVIYRAFRSRLVLCLVVAPFVFVVRQRWPGCTGAPRRAVLSVWLTTAGLLTLWTSACWFFDASRILWTVCASFYLAGAMGVWLFHVQHQFADAYWAEDDNWDFVQASLRGSSRLLLPPILRWFTADIGLHHIHHVDPRIPNYQLKVCDEALPQLRLGPSLTLSEAFTLAPAELWDPLRRQQIPISEA